MMQLWGMATLCALLGVGCDAFNDHPVEFETLASENAAPAADGGDAGGSAEPNVSEEAPACHPAAGVTVMVSDRHAITSNGGWSTTGSVSAKVAGEHATTIGIVGEGATLSFTLQKSGEQAFLVCGVHYAVAGANTAKHAGLHDETPTGGGTYALVSGSVMVDQFNAKSADGKAVINAGSYQFTFTKAAAATKAIATLIGAKAAAADAVVVRGTYYTDTLADPAAK